MSRIVPLFLAAAVLALITGCVTSQSMSLGPKTYPPRPRDYIIDVYIGTKAPANLHQSIPNPKTLSAIPNNAVELGSGFTQGAQPTPWDSLISDAMTLARNLGGDAIVIGQWENPTPAIALYGHEQPAKAISMTVIRYNP